MIPCFVSGNQSNAKSIVLVPVNDFPAWLTKQQPSVQSWLSNIKYRAEVGSVAIIPDKNGEIDFVICCVASPANMWDVGNLSFALPEGVYQFSDVSNYQEYAIAWGLGAYQFNRYKKPKRQAAQLLLPDKCCNEVESIVGSIYQVRDWINTPTDDMGPTQFAEVAANCAKELGAEFKQIIGEDLLKQNYPCIYTVGRASDDAPRLVDMRWGNPSHPKITLIGKGVCFDSGGLDIKPPAYMLLMKKDMAGGAHAFGLARMIIQAQLPVRLRVLVPVVENVISGNAYRPGDIIKSRSGITIEVGNTDCEGRVILADALTEAASEKPDIIIDITTLTGAARVAVGTDLPAVFSNNDDVVSAVIKHGEEQKDLMWRLPLYEPYKEYLNSQIADINNNASEPYAGAIVAALFLKEFVPNDIPWLHFDMMAWNIRSRPGKPVGADAFALRALLSYLKARFRS